MMNQAWQRYYMAVELAKLHRGLPNEYHSMRNPEFDWNAYYDNLRKIEFVCRQYDNMREAYFNG